MPVIDKSEESRRLRSIEVARGAIYTIERSIEKSAHPALPTMLRIHKRRLSGLLGTHEDSFARMWNVRWIESGNLIDSLDFESGNVYSALGWVVMEYLDVDEWDMIRMDEHGALWNAKDLLGLDNGEKIVLKYLGEYDNTRAYVREVLQVG